MRKYKFRQEDFSLYRPKKYYIPGGEKQAEAEQLAHREYLQKYKYYEDLPRATDYTYGMHRPDTMLNTLRLLSIGVSYIGGRILAIEYYGIYLNDYLIWKWRIGSFLLMQLAIKYMVYTSP